MGILSKLTKSNRSFGSLLLGEYTILSSSLLRFNFGTRGPLFLVRQNTTWVWTLGVNAHQLTGRITPKRYYFNPKYLYTYLAGIMKQCESSETPVPVLDKALKTVTDISKAEGVKPKLFEWDGIQVSIRDALKGLGVKLLDKEFVVSERVLHDDVTAVDVHLIRTGIVGSETESYGLLQACAVVKTGGRSESLKTIRIDRNNLLFGTRGYYGLSDNFWNAGKKARNFSRSEVVAIYEAHRKAFEKGNTSELAKLFSEGAELRSPFVSDLEAELGEMTGREKIVQRTKLFQQTYEVVNVTLENLYHDKAQSNWVVVDQAVTLRERSSGKSFTDRDLLLLVLNEKGEICLFRNHIDPGEQEQRLMHQWGEEEKEEG
jgi:hypothetical protein